jgi:hypothetical protein
MAKQQVIKSNRFLLVGLIVATGVLFTTLQMQQSLFQGQLSMPTTYDDLAYFVDALRRLDRFYEQGIGRLILDFFQLPPHSPTSIYTASFAFSIFGRQDWAPAAVNGIYVIAFLFFIAYTTSHLSWFYRIAIAVIMLTCPLLGHLVVESRPDILCGLATACASFLILQNFSFRKRRSCQVLVGAITGLALLAKPSTSPITAIILFSALLFSVIQNTFESQRQSNSKTQKQSYPGNILRNFSGCGLFISTTLLIILPYYLFAARIIFSYIYINVFGRDKEIWQYQDSLIGQVLYYISGAGGKMMFGAWGAIVLLTLLLSLAVALLSKDWQYLWGSIPYVLLVSVTYLLVTIPKTKSVFLGMAFGGTIVLSTLYLLIYIAQSLERHLSPQTHRIIGKAICVTLSIISLSSFQWAWFNKTGSPTAASATQVSYEHQLVRLVSQRLQNEIAGAPSNCAPRVAFTATAPYLNAVVLEYDWRKQRLPINYIPWTNNRSSRFLEHWRGIQQADYIVAFSLDNSTKMSWLPSNEVQPRILRRLRSDPRFELLDTFERPALLSPGKVFLYRTKQPCKLLPEDSSQLWGE